MKRDNPLGLTPEELAELAAFDAEVDQDDEGLTTAELAAACRLDREHGEVYNSFSARRQREYNRKNREKRNAQSRQYYWAAPEKYRETSRRWYANHTQHRKEYAQAYYRERKEEYNAKEHDRMVVWGPYGQQIREAREARGWSQQELAGRLGLARGQSVAKYETGRRQIDWERFRAVMPELGPQPENYPPRNTRPGRPRQEEEII